MNILIKGIDMPKDSKGIELVFIPKYGDIINNESMSIGADRIIEIPTPHGRLIPLEDVFRAFPELEPYRQGLTGLTILEAEEE